MQIIYLGNPVPENEVSSTRVRNVNMADNIAENTIIRGLSRNFKDKLTVITLSDKTNVSNLRLDKTRVRTARFINYGPITFYMSILISYTKVLRSILKNISKNEKIIIITNGPYIYVALPVFINRMFKKNIKWVPFLIGGVIVAGEKFPFNLVSALSKYTIKRADAAITYVERNVLDYIPNKPYIEIAYTIEDEVLKKDTKNTRKNSDKDFTISYTGTLNDIYSLDKIMQVIKKTGSKYRWVFAGTGKYESHISILSQAKEYRVEFRGVVDKTDAIKIQKDSNLLLLIRSGKSTIDDYSNKYYASGKLSEYIASGTPILASDIPAFSQSVRQFATFKKNDSVDEIIFNIEKIELDYHKYLKKAELGQVYARKNFKETYQSDRIYHFLVKNSNLPTIDR